jgi:hypothetical protein
VAFWLRLSVPKVNFRPACFALMMNVSSGTLATSFISNSQLFRFRDFDDSVYALRRPELAILARDWDWEECWPGEDIDRLMVITCSMNCR